MEECKRSEYDSLVPLLYGDHVEGNLHFTVFATFSRRHDPPLLNGVTLRLKELKDEQAMLDLLRAKYGEPVSSGKTPLVDTVLWSGRPTPADEVMFVKVNRKGGPSIAVVYQRRRASSGN